MFKTILLTINTLIDIVNRNQTQINEIVKCIKHIQIRVTFAITIQTDFKELITKFKFN